MKFKFRNIFKKKSTIIEINENINTNYNSQTTSSSISSTISSFSSLSSNLTKSTNSSYNSINNSINNSNNNNNNLTVSSSSYNYINTYSSNNKCNNNNNNNNNNNKNIKQYSSTFDLKSFLHLQHLENEELKQENFNYNNETDQEKYFYKTSSSLFPSTISKNTTYKFNFENNNPSSLSSVIVGCFDSYNPKKYPYNNYIQV